MVAVAVVVIVMIVRARSILREVLDVPDEVVEGVADVTDGANVIDVGGMAPGPNRRLDRIVMGSFANRELPVWGQGALCPRRVN